MDEREANKELLRRLLAAADRGDLDTVEQSFSPGYQDHLPPFRKASGEPPRPREIFSAFLSAFRDVEHEILDLVAEEDRVAARIRARGTHSGTLRGHPGTGRTFEVEAISIYRIREGRIMERWSFGSPGILEQLARASEGGSGAEATTQRGIGRDR